MSLIQDALKRQQQENAQQGAADTKPPVQQPQNGQLSMRKPGTAQPSAPENPAPSPTGQAIGEPIEQAEPEKKKQYLKVVILVVILLVAAGALLRPYLTSKKQKTAPANATNEQSNVQQATTSAPAPAVISNELVKPPSSGTVAPEPAKGVQTQATVKVEAPVIKPPEPVNPATPPAPVVAPPTIEPPVVWPNLVVSGIFEGKGSIRSSAIINKQMVSVGETIEGVKLIAVRDMGVELEYKGKRQYVKNRSSTQ